MSAEARSALALAQASPEQKTVHDLLRRMEPQIQQALPAQIGAERFTRLVLTELRRNPVLYECEPASLLGAMMLSAQLGLEPGPLGHVYLVPYKRQVQWILGYKGMIALAHRSERVKDIVAKTVYDGDGFSYFESEQGPRLRHTPVPPAGRGSERLWYARARLLGGGAQVVVLYPEDVEAARMRSPSGREGKGPWKTDYDAMARKTCVRRLASYLPLSATEGHAIVRDEAVVSGLSEEGVVEGEAQEEGEGNGESE